jgi:hypothetical protein
VAANPPSNRLSRFVENYITLNERICQSLIKNILRISSLPPAQPDPINVYKRPRRLKRHVRRYATAPNADTALSELLVALEPLSSITKCPAAHRGGFGGGFGQASVSVENKTDSGRPALGLPYKWPHDWDK